MRAYIREHLKIILIVTAALVCTGLGIASPVIIAKMQPVLSEELSVIEIEAEEGVYDYTGNAITPKIKKIIFEDKENQKITKKSGEFKVESYVDNIEVGQAGVEISMDGFQGTLVIKDVFTIRPAKASGLGIASANREMIQISWEETIGADGYVLYKSNDAGTNYLQICDVKAGEELSFKDTEVQCNAIYMYYVCAYVVIDDEVVFGNASETVKCYTSLENPTISAVNYTAYNTLKIEWPVVAGAAGYQVYKSDKQDGEYQLVKELTDGAASSYEDATCECGKSYYYYIKVCQVTETETIYGEASAIVSGRTAPSRVSLNGATTESNTKVALSWKKSSGAQGYEVYKNNQLVKTIDSADTLSWTETGLSKEAEAAYKVRAYCVVDGEKIYGSYSGNYQKEYTIVYDYSAVSSDVSALTQYAGYTYRFGGTSSTTGWDCSGFTQYVFAKHYGINLARTAAAQASQGSVVSKNDRSAWKPGDLIFYTENGRTISHVAIYLGNGQLIHALSDKYDTLIQDVDYYERWDRATSMYCVRRYF